ncbi:MAG TPA: VWA domain-containing protein [Phycisphaerae bacterium]|nr:VWA domain-containing protein [Phycisphaerales bacterium]HRX87120.1 VWA domain-containing protein [Phycisphaerae bacterium]
MRTNAWPYACTTVVTLLVAVLAGCAAGPEAAEQPVPSPTPAADTSCLTAGCDDGDGCTDDRCELAAGTYRCFHYPIVCAGGLACDPERGACVECLVDAECSDGQFCTGVEVCSDGFCRAGVAPCAGICDEVANTCVTCQTDADCDDGIYCNGAEACSNGLCFPAEPPCSAEECDEVLDACAGAFSARIIGCADADLYFDIPLPLSADVSGGLGERTRLEWSLEAELASINSTRASTIQLLVPEAEDVRVVLTATDLEPDGDGWVVRSQATTECVLPVTSAKRYLTSAPVSGVLPETFDARGGTIDLSVSPLDVKGDLIVDEIDAMSFTFRDVAVSRLGTPGVVVSTARIAPAALEVIAPHDPEVGVTVAITLDATGSMMTNDPSRLRVKAAQALVELLREKDYAAVLEFSRSLTPSPGFLGALLLQGLTKDHEQLNAAIATIGANGSTPLFDALLDSIRLLRNDAEYNPAVVVLTDGLENASVAGTFDYVVAEAVMAEIPIFPIGLGADIDFTQLQELAKATGGTFASALNPIELQALFEALGTAVTRGRTVVTAAVMFDQPLVGPGMYTVSGTLDTSIGLVTRSAPFSFQIELGGAKRVLRQTAAAEAALTH